jgi:hypothetical protein
MNTSLCRNLVARRVGTSVGVDDLLVRMMSVVPGEGHDGGDGWDGQSLR